MGETEPQITMKDLPISFVVKYLGWEPARGLWGMRHTRKPIDNLVQKAKNLKADEILPRVQLIVDKNGLVYRKIDNKSTPSKPSVFGVSEISYGVQDFVYTRVFSVIIVTDKKLDEGLTFVCHSFVCDSTNDARQLTLALAAVFQDYAEKMRHSGKKLPTGQFTIDIRSPEQQAAAANGEKEETDA